MENNWSTSVCHSIKNLEVCSQSTSSAHKTCSTHEDFNSELTLPYSYLYAYEASLDSHSEAPTSSSKPGVKIQPLKWHLHTFCISVPQRHSTHPTCWHQPSSRSFSSHVHDSYWKAKNCFPGWEKHGSANVKQTYERRHIFTVRSKNVLSLDSFVYPAMHQLSISTASSKCFVEHFELYWRKVFTQLI